MMLDVWRDMMRTTLTIDDDVLQAAKELADLQKRTTGELISEWARKGFFVQQDAAMGNESLRNGLPVLPRRLDGKIVTMKHVNDLRDETP
jgi:hypothetical protein